MEDKFTMLLSAWLVEKNVMFYILFFIVLVAALCILSAQITFVDPEDARDRHDEGARRVTAGKSPVFLFQSALIGVIGRDVRALAWVCWRSPIATSFCISCAT